MTEDDIVLQGRKVTENIYLGDDNVYRWIYELDIKQNPVQYITTVKVFIFIYIFTSLLYFIADLCNGHIGKEIFIISLGMAVFWAVILLITWPIYLLVYGGKYWALFEMDGQGIRHIQMNKTNKKAQVIWILAALLSAGNTRTTSYIAQASVNTWATVFSTVRKIKVKPKHHMIALNSMLMHNQIFVYDKDFDFVMGYILERIPHNVREKYDIVTRR